MPYSEFKNGSEWRKWDLHVHTPYSYHNDFPDWDEYVRKLKEHAVSHDIEVVGVTDYFSVEGYKRLLEECDPLYPNSPRIKLSNGKFLFLIPIVELRLDHFTAGNNSINIHVAFSPDILPDTIQQSFLEKLSIKYGALSLTLNEADLIKIGHAEENSGEFNVNLNISVLNTLQKRNLMNKALSAITFSSSTFDNALDSFAESIKGAGFKKESYLIIIANKGHGGLSDFKWSETNRDIGRAGIIRQNLLSLSDICFSNNPEDRKFLQGATTGTPKKEVINRFRSLKPCIWGSDAHNTTNLFHPSNGATNDYTWIKADPTFEGLRQTLFEPEDRVKIQIVKPDVKNARNLIQSLHFLGTDSTFGNNTIHLNDNLNAIIGGKSSGKSLLLYHRRKSRRARTPTRRA